ncbi:MAG: hypothetical protein RMJ89_10820 [Flammeovirgaceae bacterium]|nr:hypothetical protein [Flammeovirgaceae bacterium]
MADNKELAYKTVFVKAKKEARRSTFDRLRSVKIIGDKTAEEVTEALNQLHEEGYEIISVAPVSSGSSSNVGTGGWGFSYTDGILITGRKRK